MRRQLEVMAVAAVICLLSTTINLRPADAYLPTQKGACSTVTWKSSPAVIIHVNEWWLGGGAGHTTPDLADIFEAVYDVNREFNRVNGTSAWIGGQFPGSAGISISPFESGIWDNSTESIIHVGFTSDPTVLVPGQFGVTELQNPDFQCKYSEATITFPAPDIQSWNYNTPQDTDENYYTALGTDARDAQWFRPVYLHELLHAFGLSHSDKYAFTNYGDRAWATDKQSLSGPDAEATSIRPLPDDIAGLRFLYPATGTQSQIAVLNTWHNPSSTQGTAGYQRLNCKPSLGTTDSVAFDAAFCGTGGPDAGSIEVCPDDTLHTRFTVANYSTQRVNLEAQMYLSPDDVLSTASDWISANKYPISANAAESGNYAQIWQVPDPSPANADYHVIVRLTGTTTSGVSVDDWIPLTGTVHVLPWSQWPIRCFA